MTDKPVDDSCLFRPENSLEAIEGIVIDAGPCQEGERLVDKYGMGDKIIIEHLEKCPECRKHLGH